MSDQGDEDAVLLGSGKVSMRRFPLDVVLVMAVGFAAALYGVFVPHGSMTEYGYDGSVYLGASIRLAHGVLPYRDFVFGQPPGISLLALPVSFASIVFGTNVGLWLARLAMILAVTANCGLVAVLMRRFGIAASLTGGLYLALFSAAYAADSQLKLEPVLVLLCLIGALLLFEGRGIASGSRALWSGIALGIAGLVKLTAILPAIVMLLLIACYRRAMLGRFIGGAALAFGIGILPFLVSSPSSFVRDAFYSQLSPSGGRGAGTTNGLVGRAELMALSDLRAVVNLFPSSGGITSLWVALAVLVLAALTIAIRRSTMTALEWFGAGALALVTLALLASPHFFSYYLYFQAPFIALTLAPMVAWVLLQVRRLVGGRRLRLTIIFTAAACLLAGSVLAWSAQASYSEAYAASLTLPGPLGFVSSVIPSGSCVVTDDAYLALVSNRFTPAANGCPAMVDAYGTWFAARPSDPPPSSTPFPKLTDQWQRMFSASDYVLLDNWTEEFIPWTPALRAWFSQNFEQLASHYGISVYRNEHITPR